MVATLTHFIFGALGWAFFPAVPLWVALLLSQLPDLDFIIGLFSEDYHKHRRYFHNIFAVALMIGISSYFFGFWPSLLFIGLHMLLDLFDSEGVPLLYPFSKKSYLIYEAGHVRKLPEKIYWDGTWWFVGVAAVVFAVYFLIGLI